MRSLTKMTCVYMLLLLGHKAYAQNERLTAIDSMKKELAAAKMDSNRLKTVFRIATGYTNVNTDSAMAYTLSGLAQAKKMGWEKGIAAFYNSLGNLNSDNGNFDKALYYYKASYLLNKSIGNKINAASNLLNIGSVYQRQGNGAKSLPYTFQALKIAEAIKAVDLMANAYNNIAKVYFGQNDFEKALTYNLKALKTYQQEHNNNGIASTNNTVGNVYYSLKNFKQASAYYDKSLTQYRAVGNKTGEATVLSQIGLMYDNDKDKKLGYLLSAQKIFDEVDPLYAISITNIGNIGGTYADVFMDNYIKKDATYQYIPKNYYLVAKKAEEYLNKAVNYSRQVGDVDNLSYFMDNLAKLQEAKGEYQSALNNYRLSRSINDSLYSQENKNKIAALEAQYTFQKKEDGYRQQQQISQFKIRQLLLYAALIIVLISSVLIYLLNRSRISQLRLRNELQKKEAEEQTRELLHRNKLSESELKAIRAQMNPHFIFNVLNSIESYIIENDSKTASRLVQKFAALSRIILENSTQSLVTAEREWKALKLYTELEAMRFNNQFTYSFFADELIDLSTLLIPPMLVQPLIENSIHHGLRNSPDAGNAVNVRLEQTESHVYFTVEDNGAGINEAEKVKTFSAIKGKSIGLSAIRERIDIINVLYEGKDAAFEVRKKTKEEGQGTIAILTLPKTFH